MQQSGDGDATETRECLERFIDFWVKLAEDHGANMRFQSGGKQHKSLIKPFRVPGDGRETLQSLRHVDTPLKLVVPTLTLDSQTAKS